jgi:hypothetical protein
VNCLRSGTRHWERNVGFNPDRFRGKCCVPWHILVHTH